MNDHIKFCTMYLPCSNIELNKDVGQIPYTLDKVYGFESTVAGCNIEPTLVDSKIQKSLGLLNIKFLGNKEITGIIFILKNAKIIDWINFYHGGRSVYYWSKLYKFLNPKGKIYLKLDMDYRLCDKYEKSKRERSIFFKNTKIADLISVESEAVKARIQKFSAKEILLVRNGISNCDIIPDINGKRENAFLTVARLGTRQKATDILLEAFAKSADQHDWNLKLVGTVDDTFKPYISNFFEKHPELVNRVNFAGEIKDRAKLYDEYCKSKVFVLASRWESYGISCAEALSCGCRLILSDAIPPAKEMTDNGKYGKIIKPDDVDLLSEAMIEATRTEYTQKDICERVDYAKKMFSWEKICEQLYDAMEQVDGRTNGI